MKTAGIICEYNPFHLGHAGHIQKTRRLLSNGGEQDEGTAIVCVMSGNYVQRGDFAVLNKQARAEMAIRSGADLVIELPVPHVLQSAEGFAKAGVFILDRLGICDYLSFGSESGDINILTEAAETIVSEEAHILLKEWLGKGISYASAQQKAADTLLETKAEVFQSPNNVLGIEYIKAINKYKSSMQPITVKRTGGDHDSDSGYSATALRKALLRDSIPRSLMTKSAAEICEEELIAGRGPVSISKAELMILSRLRAIKDFSDVPGISEGLERRFKRFIAAEPSVASILAKVKTKRYPMSRLRRILMCAVLGICIEDAETIPPYARVLAMNKKGMELLGKARETSKMPIITKPASVYKHNEKAIRIFELEAAATDFYVLAYQNEKERTGGSEWRQSPTVVAEE